MTVERTIPDETAAAWSARDERDRYLRGLKARARTLLETADGKKELLREIREGLVVAMFLEKESGENEADTAYGPGNARQSRKQFKELSELVLETLGEDL